MSVEFANRKYAVVKFTETILIAILTINLCLYLKDDLLVQITFKFLVNCIVFTPSKNKRDAVIKQLYSTTN